MGLQRVKRDLVTDLAHACCNRNSWWLDTVTFSVFLTLLSVEGECGKLKGSPTQVGHPFGLCSISQRVTFFKSRRMVLGKVALLGGGDTQM